MVRASTFLTAVLLGLATVGASAAGTGAAASFFTPNGVAVDAGGNVYVADQDDTIRKITPAGVVTTLAGKAGVAGHADGIGAAASFDQPGGVAADARGNVYVADSGNSIIRKITPAGVVTTLAGNPEAKSRAADGTGAAAVFDDPNAVAVDARGNVYVADTGSNSVRKITPAGVVTTLAGGPVTSSNSNRSGATAPIGALGIAVDARGNIYVADDANTIRKITPAGVVTTFAGKSGVQGFADGTGTAASFHFPEGLAMDARGNVYVADANNNAIRKITPAGVVTTIAGKPGVPGGNANGTGAAASFNGPSAVAVDARGNVYVADSGNDSIRKITPAGVVTTFADGGERH